MAATFEAKTKSTEWEIKTSLAKTTGRTVHLIFASEPVTLGQAEDWFRTNVLHVGMPMPDSAITIYCREVVVKAADETRMFFRAEGDFDNVNEILENPLDLVTWEYDEETYEESFYKDETPGTSSGPKYARHTNGVRFSDLPKRDSGILTITLTRNVDDTKTWADFRDFRRKVNKNNVTLDGQTYTARTVRVTKISLSAIKQAASLTNYRTLVVVFKIKEDTWDQVYESLGLTEIIDGVDWPIVDADGHPIEEPWPLDAAGAAKPHRSDAGEPIALRPYATVDSFTGLV